MTVSHRKIAGVLAIVSGVLALVSSLLPWLEESYGCPSLAFGHQTWNLFEVQGQGSRHLWPSPATGLVVLVVVCAAGLILVIGGVVTLVKPHINFSLKAAASSMAVSGLGLLIGTTLSHPPANFSAPSQLVPYARCTLVDALGLGYWSCVVAGVAGIASGILVWRDPVRLSAESNPKVIEVSN